MNRSIILLGILSSSMLLAQKKETDTLKTESIEEVVMQKKVFEKKSDRFVYDVAASPQAKGSSAFSILKETPLVSSTDDKSLKIIGKSEAVIYINGRKSNMNAESLIELLKNTPAENISKIEVITTPGSEFNVESSQGIINILLKKKLDDGIGGNFRLVNNHNKVNRQSAAVSLNARKDKLGINASFSGSDFAQSQDYILRNSSGEYSNESVGPMDDPNLNLGGYVNIDYELREKSNLALSLSAYSNKSFGSRSHLFNTVTTPLETSMNITENIENAKSHNLSANLNYELKTDDLGSKLNLNIAALDYNRDQNNTNTTYVSNTLEEKLGINKQFNQQTPQKINNYAATADYIQKFKNDFAISVGANYSTTKTDNNTSLENLNLITGQFERDANQSNHFIYEEKILGVYLTAEKKFSDKLSAKVGARLENTDSFGEILNTTEKIDRNYKNVLPYLSVNYAPVQNHSVSYAFSSRIRRPSFWEINPVRIYLTPTNYVQNNPFVKASDVYNHELTYMFKNSYFLVFGHNIARDDYSQIPLQNDQEIRYIRTNFGDKKETVLSVGMQKSFFKGIWTNNTSTGVQFNHVTGILDKDPITGDTFDPFSLDTKTSSFFVQTSNNIRLSPKKDWFLGINYFYIGKQIINIGTLEPISSLDLTIKKIWNDWTFNLQGRDILRTNIVKLEDTQSNGNYNYVMNNNYTRSVELSITYTFGNKKVKKIRDINDANSDIKSRTR